MISEYTGQPLLSFVDQTHLRTENHAIHLISFYDFDSAIYQTASVSSLL